MANYMVSGDDLKYMLGDNLKIIKFNNLKNYSSIYDLLPKKRDYAVIFYIDDDTDGTNIGHWTCLLRNENKFYFFDSYGLTEEEELKFISKEKKIKYGEDEDYIKKLLKSVKHSYNKYDYQKWNDKIQTCGRWVIIKIFTFINGIITNNDFYKFIMQKMKQYKLKSFDELAVYFTE